MENDLAMRDTSQLEDWRRIISEYQESGQSVRAYCKRKGISCNSYYYYLRKTTSQVAAKPVLLPIKFAKAEQNPSMVCISYYGATIQITANDEISLCAVLSALKKV